MILLKILSLIISNVIATDNCGGVNLENLAGCHKHSNKHYFALLEGNSRGVQVMLIKDSAVVDQVDGLGIYLNNFKYDDELTSFAPLKINDTIHYPFTAYGHSRSALYIIKVEGDELVFHPFLMEGEYSEFISFENYSPPEFYDEKIKIKMNDLIIKFKIDVNYTYRYSISRDDPKTRIKEFFQEN